MAGKLVQLTYFKTDTGKFYHTGAYHTNKEQVYQVQEEVRTMLNERTLPGLVEGHFEYYVLVDCLEHTQNYPGLIIPSTVGTR